MSKDTGGPAFPFEYVNQTMEHQESFVTSQMIAPGGAEQYSGLTVRQYAAIKLGVMDSGDEWLDKMIFDSERNKLAAKALTGASASLPKCDSDQEALHMTAVIAYSIADAMLAERAK
jgi:hypothetical protein